MVAYTQEFCLPFFEGTDALCVDTGPTCEPSTVWCDMAARIDEALTEFDEAAARSVDSFPYAQVAMSSGFEIDTGDSTSETHLVLWDTVVGDSDAMVNLDTDSSTVTVRRSGIWNMHFTMVWQATVDASLMQSFLLVPGLPKASPSFVFFFEEWVQSVPDPGNGPVVGVTSSFDIFCEVDVTTGPAQFQIQLVFSGASPNNVATVAVCRYSARWVADLP
jgi:hypothetical protein